MKPDVLLKTSAEAPTSQFEWGSIQWVASAALGNAQSITVGRAVIRKGFSNPPHRHDTCEEVLYLFRGRLAHMVGDREIVMNAGDTLVIPPGENHSSRSIGEDDDEMIVAYPTGQRDFVPTGKD